MTLYVGNIAPLSGRIADEATRNAVAQLEDRLRAVQKLEFSIPGRIDASVAARAVGRTVYTSGSGTYTTPDGVAAILVECVGGGGGGGGVDQAVTNSAAGGGGGAGGYAATLIQSPNATYAYSVGAGGPGGTAGLNDGTAGSDTTWDSTTIIARGGRGGGSNQVAAVPHIGGFGGRGGGDPAVSSNVGEFTCVGNAGHYGVCLAAASAFSGVGGGSIFGGGGQGKAGPTGAGVTSPGIGGGGSGGLIYSGGADQAGGAGAAGAIIVTEFR